MWVSRERKSHFSVRLRLYTAAVELQDAWVARIRIQEPELFPAVRAALRPLVPRRLHTRIAPDASILADLGLDSLKVVELTVLLEKELGRPVFLPEWIASVDDPADLTVESLALYLARSQ